MPILIRVAEHILCETLVIGFCGAERMVFVAEACTVGWTFCLMEVACSLIALGSRVVVLVPRFNALQRDQLGTCEAAAS